MGLLRWLLWPRRRRDPEEEPEDRPRRHRSQAHPGVYRIEVDNEIGRLRRDGPPFSFWASARIILILSVLLWWIQPAGPMIAGYVGGRRSGAPWKAVLAALLPVLIILVANYSYAHNVAARQIDFVASLPVAAGDGVASILPFLGPYKDFLIGYLQSFVDALRTTFGMGTNGYLMVILFAYIGGLLGEQSRRELMFRSGAGTSVGLNLFQPLFQGRRHEDEDAEDEAQDDVDLERSRRPTHVARGRRHRHAHHGVPARFEEYRKVPAETIGARGERRSTRAHRREPDDEDDEEDEEEALPARGRHPSHGRAVTRSEHIRAEREVEPPSRESREKRALKPRSHEEEVAIQRFVERALRQYDRSKL